MSQPDDTPRIVAAEEHIGRDKLRMTTVSTYVPPLDGTDDEVKGFDMHVAKGVITILSKKYFGYPWMVTVETRQGIIMFQIPELMGPTLQYVIRLAEYKDLDPALIIRCGGELLERMGLPRTQIDMAAYAHARSNKHKFQFGDVKR